MYFVFHPHSIPPPLNPRNRVPQCLHNYERVDAMNAMMTVAFFFLTKFLGCCTKYMIKSLTQC
jgi:hypothetical protein